MTRRCVCACGCQRDLTLFPSRINRYTRCHHCRMSSTRRCARVHRDRQPQNALPKSQRPVAGDYSAAQIDAILARLKAEKRPSWRRAV